MSIESGNISGEIVKQKTKFKTLRGLADVFKDMMDEVLGVFKKNDIPNNDNFYVGECGRGDGPDRPMISIEEHEAMVARTAEILKTHRVFNKK